MNYKSTTTAFLLLAVILFNPNSSSVLATSVDRMVMTNIEGYGGKTVKQTVTIEGTSHETREGYWYTHYKKIDGDDGRMDISSWITIKPEKYFISQHEKKEFTIEIKIPRDAQPGLYGAISLDAGKEGHSNERRMYVVFKDTLPGGNVYSGLLIPISVNVLQNKNPLETAYNFIVNNSVVIGLLTIIIIMGSLLLRKKRSK